MDRHFKTYSFVLAAALALAAMFTVSGCGEDYLVSEDDVAYFEQYIFVLPDRFAGIPYVYSKPVNTLYIDTNETVKFWAVYKVNGAFLPSDSADKHYISHSWTIDGEEYNISPLRFSFKTPGYRLGILQTVDMFMDTLRDTIHIFVNTPISISPVAPVNGYNQVDVGYDGEVELHWNISGLDPWETSSCNLFASLYKDSVWDHSLGYVDCQEYAKIFGPFLKDSLMDILEEDPERDTSATIYWAIKATFRAEGGFVETDSTEILSFSTLYLREDSSVIVIPIKHEDYRKTDVFTRVVITNRQGDTLFIKDMTYSPSIVSAKVTPQTGLHIYVQELSKEEFQPESLTVDASRGAKTIVDTIKLQDRIQPQVAPHIFIRDGAIKTAIKEDSLYFYTIDNGTGINLNKIVVTADSNIISHAFDDTFIKFKVPCKKTCKIRLYVEDYAHNSNPKVYWSYTPDATKPTLEGPFSELGADQ